MTENNKRSSGCSRRRFLAGAGLGIVGGGALGWLGRHWLFPGRQARDPLSPVVPPAESQALAMPGPFPGKVIEVNHPGALGTARRQGYTARNRPAIKAMIDRGMKELVGSDDAVGAWRRFFSPGDRVGIKVVPVGRPDSISSYEVILEVIDGLRSAGVKPGDILLFERYKNEMMSCGYHDMLPEGVHWECSSSRYDDLQLSLDGQIPGSPFEDHVSGYDPDIYRELNFCLPEHDPKDDRRLRSHLSLIVSRKVDKIVAIPVLKDHRAAGVTLALKNLSHGLVNNVCRSHIVFSQGRRQGPGSTLNQCLTFIPAIAALPPIRAKTVLHILDGLVGTWEGGPKTSYRTFATWEYQSLFFATDPVALDRVGWDIIDQKRASENWPAVAQMGLDSRTGVGMVDGRPYPEIMHMRQPQHVALAETLGLGIFDRARIDHRRVELKP